MYTCVKTSNKQCRCNGNEVTLNGNTVTLWNGDKGTFDGANVINFQSGIRWKKPRGKQHRIDHN